MSEFNFNSQPATSIEQSEKLLALGLKRETADMGWVKLLEGDGYVMVIAEDYSFIDTPAWTFDRLLELMPQTIVKEECTCFQYNKCTIQFCLSTTPFYNSVEYEMPVYFNMQYLHQERKDSRLESAIAMCEWLIKEGYFNKEYLVWHRNTR